jgi:fumarate reductase subunit D
MINGYPLPIENSEEPILYLAFIESQQWTSLIISVIHLLLSRTLAIRRRGKRRSDVA